MAAKRGSPSPGEARRLRRGAEAVHPVGLEPSPERRATDPEPARSLRELAAGVLKRRGDGLALALSESEWSSLRKDRRFAEILRAVFQEREPGTETLQSVAHVTVLSVDDAPRAGVRVEQAAWLIEDHDTLGNRIDDRTHEGGKRCGDAARRADRLVDHWLVTLTQNMPVQGFMRTTLAVDSCQDETRSWGKRLLVSPGLGPF